MNKVVLVGNLTRDPELTTTTNGIAVSRFSIAVGRSYTNADGERETDFLNIVAWRGLAENCARYLSKGKKVAVSGSIQTRSYEDNNGNKRYATDIVAEEVEFLTPANTGAEETKQAVKKNKEDLVPVDDDEKLPF